MKTYAGVEYYAGPEMRTYRVVFYYRAAPELQLTCQVVALSSLSAVTQVQSHDDTVVVSVEAV